jgi:hypothetical protein
MAGTDNKDSEMSDIVKPTCADDLWDPEIDTYYDAVDEATGTIEFRKEHPTYTTLRSALIGIGINIDDVKTEAELEEVETRHSDRINNFIEARLFNDKNPSLERQLLKATLVGDYVESKRIRELLKKRKTIGLRLIKE